MEYLTGLFGNQPNFTAILQIGMDILILGLLAVLLGGRKRRTTDKDREVIVSFEKIIEQTGTISDEFGMNLEKRQELIKEITAALDERIQEARDSSDRIERALKKAAEDLNAFESAKTAPAPSAIRQSAKTDQQKVFFLADKGMDAAGIAKSLKKPVGEVELILNLRKITPS